MIGMLTGANESWIARWFGTVSIATLPGEGGVWMSACGDDQECLCYSA